MPVTRFARPIGGFLEGFRQGEQDELETQKAMSKLRLDEQTAQQKRELFPEELERLRAQTEASRGQESRLAGREDATRTGLRLGNDLDRQRILESEQKVRQLTAEENVQLGILQEQQRGLGARTDIAIDQNDMEKGLWFGKLDLQDAEIAAKGMQLRLNQQLYDQQEQMAPEEFKQAVMESHRRARVITGLDIGNATAQAEFDQLLKENPERLAELELRNEQRMLDQRQQVKTDPLDVKEQQARIAKSEMNNVVQDLELQLRKQAQGSAFSTQKFQQNQDMLEQMLVRRYQIPLLRVRAMDLNEKLNLAGLDSDEIPQVGGPAFPETFADKVGDTAENALDFALFDEDGNPRVQSAIQSASTSVSDVLSSSLDGIE